MSELVSKSSSMWATTDLKIYCLSYLIFKLDTLDVVDTIAVQRTRHIRTW